MIRRWRRVDPEAKVVVDVVTQQLIAPVPGELAGECDRSADRADETAVGGEKRELQCVGRVQKISG